MKEDEEIRGPKLVEDLGSEHLGGRTYVGWGEFYGGLGCVGGLEH